MVMLSEIRNRSSDPNIITEANLTCTLVYRLIERQVASFSGKIQFSTTLIILSVLVIVVGSMGNALLVGVALRTGSKTRTIQNNFIALLAFSDFLMCAITVPFTLKNTLSVLWDFGTVACKLISSIQGVNIFVSTMCITAISLDRYFLILFPTNRRAQHLVPIASLFAIWPVALLMAMPIFFATNLQSILPPDHSVSHYLEANCQHYVVKMCIENGFTPLGKRIYTCFCTLFQYVLPLCGLTFLNAQIQTSLAKRSRALRSQQDLKLQDPSRIQGANQNRRNRVKHVVKIVVITFAITWLPWNLYCILIAFNRSYYNISYFAICHLIAMLSACLNPIIYGVFNRNFRDEFKRILRCQMNCKRIEAATQEEEVIKLNRGSNSHEG